MILKNFGYLNLYTEEEFSVFITQRFKSTFVYLFKFPHDYRGIKIVQFIEYLFKILNKVEIDLMKHKISHILLSNHSQLSRIGAFHLFKARHSR